jgi:hypothetical protein
MGAGAVRALVIAVASAGCLSAPAEKGGVGGGDRDAGEGDAAHADATPCDVIAEDDFQTGEVHPGRWVPYTEDGGTIVPDAEAGSVTLRAPGKGGGSYAELESATTAGIAGTVLEVRFTAETTGEGEVFVGLEVDDLNSIAFFVYQGRLWAELEADDGDIPICDNDCPLYEDGDLVSVRFTADTDSARLEWSTDGEDFVPLGTSEIVPGDAYLQVHAYAADVSTASATVDRVLWRACD